MKKDIPLAILEQLEKFVNLQGELFQVERLSKSLIEVKDIDPQSNFVFKVVNYKIEKTLKLEIFKQPIDKNTVGGRKFWIDLKHLGHHFDSWKNLVESHNNISSFFDDVIIEEYFNQFVSRIEVIEPERNKPLSLQQLIVVDNYLEAIDVEVKNIAQSTQQEQISDAISDLRGELSSISKQSFVTRLAYIFAMITVRSMDLFRKISSSTSKLSMNKFLDKAIVRHE
jgi:hypothetical protein